MTRIVDPTDERTPFSRTLAARPGRIAGAVALLDIAKPRGDVFLDRVEQRLADRLPGVTLKRYRKPTFAKPAPEDLLRRIAFENGFVIEALAD
jgi:hypothetical protein